MILVDIIRSNQRLCDQCMYGMFRKYKRKDTEERRKENEEKEEEKERQKWRTGKG